MIRVIGSSISPDDRVTVWKHGDVGWLLDVVFDLITGALVPKTPWRVFRTLMIVGMLVVAYLLARQADVLPSAIR